MDKKNMGQLSQVIAKINEKNPYYLIIGLLFVILILDYMLVMQFQLRTLSSLNPKIKTLAEEVTTTRNNIRRLSQYKEEIARLGGELERINQRIRRREEIPHILENISVLANKNGVKIEQIMPDTQLDEPILKNNEGQYFPVPIIIEAKSGYHNFGRFLNQMEEEGVLMNVSEFTIAANAQDMRWHSIKLTINTIVFDKTQR